MFEKEKKQYQEDSKTHERRPWELWQYAVKNSDVLDWCDLSSAPIWKDHLVYRRKITASVNLEYYSGLNWRDAEQLIGKTVECTNNPDSCWYVGTLKHVSKNEGIAHFGVLSDGDVDSFVYIRTCEETFKHTTINIGGFELPMPETVAPATGSVYWIFCPPYKAYNGSIYDNGVWPKDVSKFDKQSLKNGAIHLTEERAKAWADWWKATVIDKMK